MALPLVLSLFSFCLFGICAVIFLLSLKSLYPYLVRSSFGDLRYNLRFSTFNYIYFKTRLQGLLKACIHGIYYVKSPLRPRYSAGLFGKWGGDDAEKS